MTFTSIWLLEQVKEQVQEHVCLRQTSTLHPFLKQSECESESVWGITEVINNYQHRFYAPFEIVILW